MKKFTKLVGILLCLAMMLSILPASVVSAATPDTNTLEELTDVVTPVIGYYSNNNTDGDITNHSNASYAPANMVDGNTTNQARSGYFTYNEIATGAKIPVILFDFDNNTTLGAIEIYGYQTSRYNMEDFEIQILTADGWQTAATVTDAFYVEGSFGDDLTGPLKVEFEQAYTGTQLRILVSAISDMTPDGAEDAEMLEGGYIRIREIKLFGSVSETEEEVSYPEIAKLNGVNIEDYKIVYSAAELDYNLRAAEYIQAQILKKTGRTVEIVEDDTAETANEILVGETNRSLSASLTAPGNLQMKFSLQANGTKIAMEADYFIIAGAAYYFVDTFIGKTNFENTVPSEKQELTPITKKAKNYIFLIGDGMGYMQTRFFEKFGASPTTGTYGFGDGEDVFYGYYFPYQGESKTCNVFGTITDSAAGGTALATGYKTVNGYVGRDMLENDITNLSELAWGMGKAVGIMSTEGSDGATPASFSAHTSGRYDNEVITDQDALEAQGYLFVERYRSSADAANAVFKSFTAEEFTRWDAKVQNGLNKLAQDPDGFFMMYEEAYIDKNCHNDDQQNAYRTVYRFNQHIANFMEFAMYNPDTFVLITADHETSGLNEDFVATQFNLPPDVGCDHSLQNVPVFAYGVGGELFNNVVAHNTSIGRTFAHLMTNGNADDFGDPQYPILTEGYVAPEVTPDTDTPDAPTTPVVQGTILKVVSPTKITAKFGVYTGGNPNGTFDDGGDGECLTDGWYYRSAYSERNKSAGLTAAILNLNTTVNLGGIEFTGHKEAGHDPTNFEVQAMVNGQWQTVYTVTSHPFAEGPRTVKYTFEPVMTNQVRVLIHDHQGTEDCYIGEITLFESTTGNLSQKVEVVDKKNVLTDGDKANCFTGDNVQIVLAANGQPTAVSGFNLYLARAKGTAVPTSVTITIQTSLSGTFVPIGVFPTGWNDEYPKDSVFVEFDKTYVAYAMHVTFDKRSSATELELFQHIHEDAPEVAPTVITKQPVTSYITNGTTATLTVEATGTELSYQWQSSTDGTTWSNCSSENAVNATFTFTGKTRHNGNYYRCEITNAEGDKVYTNIARLYVLGVTTQPKAQQVKAGTAVKLTVKATGDALTYKWQSSTDGKTWKDCASSSSVKATFTFTGKTSHNGNYYRCKVTDSTGNTVYTDAVRLYVLGITTQPTAQKVEAGVTVKFTAKATGKGLKYQWQSSADGKTWKNCSSSSATKATFTFTGKDKHNGNYYRCKVTDSAGNVVYTDAVQLKILSGTAITKQPTTSSIKTGTTAKLTVTAIGTGLKYQWQSSADGKTWKNCSSTTAKNATFTFTGKTSHNGNYYRCKITDSTGKVIYSDSVRLYVLGVTTQPKTQKVEAGTAVKFTVKATGKGLTYQWQSSADGKTWKNCSSSTAKNATFTFTGKTSHNGNYYRCKVTDSAGNVVYSSSVRLYVLGITTQPVNKEVEAGETVKFTVKATGTGLTYQWQSSANGKTWKNCSSSTAVKATFTFTGKTSHNGNYYRCKVTDSAGNVVYTNAVSLKVIVWDPEWSTPSDPEWSK